MTENRNVKMGDGNYNQNIQGNYNDFGFKCKKQHARFVLFMLVGTGIACILSGFKNLLTNDFICPTKLLLILGCLLLALICIYYVFFWEPSISPRSKITWKLFAAVGMVLIPVLTFTGVGFWMNAPTNTIVTFANYYSQKQELPNVNTLLLNMLQEDTKIENEKDIVEIKPINKAFSGTQEKEATSEGKDRRATISIWGDYTTTNQSGENFVQINSILAILKQELVFFLSEQTKDDQFKNKSEKSGYLKEVVNRHAIKQSELDIELNIKADINGKSNKQEIRQNLAYITNLFAGIALYKSGLTYCDPRSKEATESFKKSRKYLDLARQRLKSIEENEEKKEKKENYNHKKYKHFLTGVSNFYKGNIDLYNTYCSNQPNYLNSAIDSFTEAIKSIGEYAVTSDNKQNSDIVESPYRLIPASYHPEEEYHLSFNDSNDNKGIKEITCGKKRDKNVRVSNSRRGFKILLSRIYHNRGIAYEMKGKIQEALNDYDRAIQLDPKTDEFCLSLGSAYANLSNYYPNLNNYRWRDRNNNADDYRRLAIKNYKNAEDSLAYYNLGNIDLREHNYPGAIINYLLAIKSDLNFSEAYNNLKIAAFEPVRPAFERVGDAFERVGHAFNSLITDLKKELRSPSKPKQHPKHPNRIPVYGPPPHPHSPLIPALGL